MKNGKSTLDQLTSDGDEVVNSSVGRKVLELVILKYLSRKKNHQKSFMIVMLNKSPSYLFAGTYFPIPYMILQYNIVMINKAINGGSTDK